MREIEVPVLIVGAGGAGLSASNFLADVGVGSLLIERHPSTSHLPKAHGMSARTMEIFRHHGLADEIYRHAAPRANLGRVRWYTSIGGDDPLDRRMFAESSVMGGGEYAAEYDRHSPVAGTHLPQMQLEPILRRFAEERNPGHVLFRHEFRSLEQDADGVTAIVQDLEADEPIRVRCKYLIAGDAGKSVGPAVGVKMIGPTNLQDMVVVHISADLSEYIQEDDSVMRMIVHPRQVSNVSGAQFFGALMTMGPERWDRHSSNWGVAWAYNADDPHRHNSTDIIPRIKEFLKVDVPIEVHNISHWYLQGVVADQFKVGRVFIVGDAAHQHAPGGGLGFTSAVMDSHNLAWKIAHVLKGLAPESLLDSYEVERRPVVTQNAEWSLFSLLQHRILHSAMGLSYQADGEQNVAAFNQLLADTPDGEARRARLREVMKIARSEYAIMDKEFGFTYPKGAVVDDGTPFPPRDPMGHVYTPATRPGCRFPHVWLRRDGQAVSTLDLLPLGGFLLVTGADGAAWLAAAGKVSASTGVTIRGVRIAEGRDAEDPSGGWAEVRGIADDGVILVRPDGYVGYRSRGAVADPGRALEGALTAILAAA